MKAKPLGLIDARNLSASKKEEIITRILLDGWGASQIIYHYELTLDSFYYVFYDKYKDYLNKPVFIGNRSAYYEDEKYHPFRKADNMCLWVNPFSNSQTIKEYVLENKIKK